MKYTTKIFVLLAALLCVSTAYSQQVPSTSVGPMNPYSVVCNPQNAVATGFDCPLNQESAGSTFTAGTGTGECATAAANLLGGLTAGSFTCGGTAGASTQIINLPTAAHGWVCSGSDTVTGAAVTSETVSTTSAKLIFTTTTNTDVVAFSCHGY